MLGGWSSLNLALLVLSKLFLPYNDFVFIQSVPNMASEENIRDQRLLPFTPCFKIFIVLGTNMIPTWVRPVGGVKPKYPRTLLLSLWITTGVAVNYAGHRQNIVVAPTTLVWKPLYEHQRWKFLNLICLGMIIWA